MFNSNGMFSPVLGSYNAMMGRANQIENESRKREQAVLIFLKEKKK